ncbi:MAG: hypothetical protein A2097_04420, partial [Desulfobacula sp. GWF2_41_7]
WKLNKKGYIMFSNFEKNLLHLPDAGTYNFYIIIIFLILITISVQKKTENSFFDVSQTIQVKGLAIFFVVLAHFWENIFDQTPPLILSRYSVSLFFILSGYAHGLLCETGRFDYKGFIQKKIFRIFIPYWICTILFLVLDYYLLDRTHSMHDIFLTSSGINIHRGQTHLDRTRWFISLLLLWYFVFCSSRHFCPKKISLILYMVAFLLIVMRYLQIWHLGNVHETLAFPVGYTIAQNRSWISKVFMNTSIRQKGIHCLMLVSFCVGILCIKITGLDNYFLFESLEKIFKLMVLSYGLLIGLSINSILNYQSKVLFFMGQISYELYILHFPFLYRYNPLKPSLIQDHAVIMFYVLLMILIVFSLVLKTLCPADRGS